MINVNVTQLNKICIYYCKLNSWNKIEHVCSRLLSNLQFESYCTIRLNAKKLLVKQISQQDENKTKQKIVIK